MQAKIQWERLICASVEKSHGKDGVTHLEVLVVQGLLQCLEMQIIIACWVVDKHGLNINEHRK